MVDNENENVRWIHVTGVGEVSASPDMAILRLGVLTTAKTAKLSTELNNQAILKIFDVLEDLGIAKDDYETERFQLVPSTTIPERAVSINHWLSSD